MKNSILDVFYKSATVLIALANFIYAILLFKKRSTKEEYEKEKDRRLDLFKILILDKNLEKFHDIFDNIEIELYKLKRDELKDKEIISIENNLMCLFTEFRSKFYRYIYAIDKNLYKEIKHIADKLQREIIYLIYIFIYNIANLYIYLLHLCYQQYFYH